MYYEAYVLIAEGEDGSALEPNTMPSSASGAQCTKLLQCLCAALEFPRQVFQILRAELFPEPTVRVTFEEFVSLMEVCLAVSGASLILAERSLSAHTESMIAHYSAFFRFSLLRARRRLPAGTTCMA